MLRLKPLLKEKRLQQSDIAEHLGVSQATVAQIVNHGVWPRSLDEAALQQQIRDFLVMKSIKLLDNLVGNKRHITQ